MVIAAVSLSISRINGLDDFCITYEYGFHIQISGSLIFLNIYLAALGLSCCKWDLVP